MRHVLRRCGGVTLAGDARTLHRAGNRWRVETDEGALDAAECVVALGPWAHDLLRMQGLKLPLAVKRGYHRHFRAQGNAGLSRPVLDAEAGYLITPMEQGIRITTGVEFAARDAKPTPVQFDRLMPKARELFPLGERADDKTWLGSRPCFPDSRPVIGRAPALSWLVAGDRPRALGSYAWPCHRTHDRRNDGGRDAVLRSGALSGGAISLTAKFIFPARQRAGERQSGRLIDAARDGARQHIGGKHAEFAER